MTATLRIPPRRLPILYEADVAVYYVEANCWSLEQLADPADIPILSKLHAFPPLRDQVSRAGFQGDHLRLSPCARWTEQVEGARVVLNKPLLRYLSPRHAEDADDRYSHLPGHGDPMYLLQAATVRSIPPPVLQPPVTDDSGYHGVPFSGRAPEMLPRYAGYRRDALVSRIAAEQRTGDG